MTLGQIETALRDRHTVQLGIIGFLAGLASILPIVGSMGLARLLDGGAIASFVIIPLFGFFLLGGPGAVFGFSIRAYLIRRSLAQVEEANALVALSTITMAVLMVVLVLMRAAGPLRLSGIAWVDAYVLFFGTLAALDAAILVTLLRLSLGFFSSWRTILFTVAGCWATGLVFWRGLLPAEVFFPLYFGLWHAVLAIGLSFGLPRRPAGVAVVGR